MKIRDLATSGDASDSLAKTDHTTISNVENGHKPASSRLLIAWAQVFELDPLTVWPGRLRKDVTHERAA